MWKENLISGIMHMVFIQFYYTYCQPILIYLHVVLHKSHLFRLYKLYLVNNYIFKIMSIYNIICLYTFLESILNSSLPCLSLFNCLFFFVPFSLFLFMQYMWLQIITTWSIQMLSCMPSWSYASPTVYLW